MLNIESANQTALERMTSARPILKGVALARDVIPGMKPNLILHAGPPISWARMSGPMRGAVIGALIYEGLAKDEKQAVSMIETGEIEFEPCHHHQAVGPMAGVTSSSMMVYVLENVTHGNKAYSNLNEGYGKVLRYGAYSPDVIEKLRWMNHTMGPILAAALAQTDGLDIRALLAEALHMGDEGHNRNKAGSLIFTKQLAPLITKISQNALLKDARPKWEISLKERLASFKPAKYEASATELLTKAIENVETAEKVIQFLGDNALSVLNPVMAACKAMCDAAHGIEGSTIVTTMARNGTDFGIRVSGLGDQWFTAPVSQPDGLYFPGYTSDDASGDIGDSTITETAGIGGFAMAAAPAIVTFISGKPKDALNATLEMYEITVGEHTAFTIPQLDFRGTPTGIDIRKVVELGITPRINTGIAHKNAGVGQVGAGLVRPPIKTFEDALIAFAEKYL
ncbi:MAG: DUF1116 domain-containing protein [Anaerolineales bacterium]